MMIMTATHETLPTKVERFYDAGPFWSAMAHYTTAGYAVTVEHGARHRVDDYDVATCSCGDTFIVPCSCGQTFTGSTREEALTKAKQHGGIN